MERDFKGIWIPKAVWLNESLTMLDKVILMEIDSLDNEYGCIADNCYLASFCQCSETKISKSISKLKKLGFLEIVSFDGRRRVIRSLLDGVQGSLAKNARQSRKICEADSQKVQDINIKEKDNIDSQKEKDKSFSKSEDVLPFFEHETDTEPQTRQPQQTSKRTMTKGGEDFEKAWVSYGRKGSKKKSLEQWSRMDSDEKERAVSHIPHYVRSRDFVYMKDFERYLRDAVYDSPVYDRNGVLVYDAARAGSSSYNPVSDGFNLHWNDHVGHWVTFSHPVSTGVIDGYDNGNRPACAEVMHQGWVYAWDTERKVWKIKQQQ